MGCLLFPSPSASEKLLSRLNGAPSKLGSKHTQEQNEPRVDKPKRLIHLLFTAGKDRFHYFLKVELVSLIEQVHLQQFQP